MEVVGIYLAAGKSSRMCVDKLALPYKGIPIGNISLLAALNSLLSKIYVVINSHRNTNWILPDILENKKINVIECQTSYLGQSESVKCGIKRAINEKANAAIILLADHPFVTEKMINDHILAIRSSPDLKFSATTYRQTILPPILFSSAMFNHLMKISGDQGARKLLKGEFLSKGKLLPIDHDTPYFDIDTNADYKKLLTMKIEMKNH